MTDKPKLEGLSADDLDQAVGGVASTAGSNPEGIVKKPGRKMEVVNEDELIGTRQKPKKRMEVVNEDEFVSGAGSDPNV